MARLWDKKTPTVTFILFGIVNVGVFIAADHSRFGYWPPAILLLAILLTAVNNLRIDRAERAGPLHQPPSSTSG